MPKCRKAISRNYTTPNMSMAATNKSLARNDKSRTWVEPTKKRRTPSRYGDSRRTRVTVPDSDRRQNEERAQTKRNRCVLRFFLRSAREERRNLEETTLINSIEQRNK